MKKMNPVFIATLAATVATLAPFAGAAEGIPVAPSARLTVQDKLNKETDSDKSESTKSSMRTDTESQSYDLNITVANTGPSDCTFNLEWYFFKRTLTNKGDKGEPVLCEKGSESIAVAGMKRASHQVSSESQISFESKTTTNNTGNKNNNNKGGSSGTKKTVSGSICGGYIVLLRYGEEIIAKDASDPRFLKDEWMGTLSRPVSKSSGNAGASDGSAKKKGKKKK